jgi:hypothetical protein
MNEPRSYKKISEKEFFKFELCVTGRWRAKKWVTADLRGGGGGVGKERNTEQPMTHIRYRRKNEGLTQKSRI